MKRSLLAFAALSAIAGVASAQSSVTLSGSLDAGIKRVAKQTGTSAGTYNDWSIGASQSAYNNFTLSGVEDLGAGTRAFFTLNHRFTLNNGVDNGFSVNGGKAAVAGAVPEPFWRVAFVGIGGGFGDVRVGRITMPLQDMNGGYDAFNIGTVGTLHTGGINATNRANNALSYRSPNLGGVSVMLSAAAGEGQLANEIGANAPQSYFPATALIGTTSKRPLGGNVRYAAGPLSVGFAYDKNAADMKTVGLYGSFDFGAVKLMSQFEKGDNYTTAASLRTTPDESVKAFSIGLTAPLGPVLLRTGLLKIKGTAINGSVPLTNRDATKFGFGGDYILSKRTNLYTDIGKWSGNRVRTAITPATTPATFNTAAQKVQFDFGVTHKF